MKIKNIWNHHLVMLWWQTNHWIGHLLQDPSSEITDYENWMEVWGSFWEARNNTYIYIAVYISYLGFTGLGKQIRIQIVILHGDEWTVHRNDWKHQNLTQEKLSKFERTRWTHHVLFSILDSRSDQQLLFIKYCFRFRGNFFGWSWTCFSSHRNHSWC